MNGANVKSVVILGAGGTLQNSFESSPKKNQIEFGFLDADGLEGGYRFPEPPACVVLDLPVPGKGGVIWLRALRRAGCTLPVLCLTPPTEVRVAVDLMKAGAFEVLEQPFGSKELLHALEKAFEKSLGGASETALSSHLAARLSPRECTVLERLLQGETNKMVAAVLDISVRTVEFHRGNINQKLGVSSLAGLIALNNDVTLLPPETS